MSLYGTGRKEGILSACAIFLLSALVHAAAAWQGLQPTYSGWVTALAGGLGGALTYRFLRAQGRSRYASFLGGCAYGMSPLFAGLVDAPRDQFAAALVPLGLEAVARCHTQRTRRTWLPWLGLCMALPFAVGMTVVSVLALTLGLGTLAVVVLHSGSGAERFPRTMLLVTLAAGAAAAANLVWLDPLGGWLGAPRAAALGAVLAGDTTPTVVVRVVGPFLVWFALLGILRRQRHVSTSIWLLLALVGAAPTALVATCGAEDVLPLLTTTWAVPAVSWWLSVLAITVMGAAGLDDWLDQPQRRRGAHLWLLLLTLFVAPALPLADAEVDPASLATVLGTFAALATVTLVWRRLGVLRFKSVLTAVALGAFAVPVLWRAPGGSAQAAPLGEAAAPSWSRVAEHLAAAPTSHFTGLISALVACAALLVAVRIRRR